MTARCPSDWRPTLTAILRLAEQGTFQLEQCHYGDWSARAVLRGEKLETWTCWYSAATIGAALRTLLRELRRELRTKQHARAAKKARQR
jgi:hypothetical protein